MSFNPKEIGVRIAAARERAGYDTQEELASALRELLNKRNGRARKKITLARQTVGNWEAGHTVPPWNRVEAMAQLFRPGDDEEWLLFGRRGAGKPHEELVLSYLRPDEIRLVDVYRHTAKPARGSTIAAAEKIQHQHPAKP